MRKKYHVTPVNDLIEHTDNDCWCEPIDKDDVIVHNSADGREYIESDNEKYLGTDKTISIF